MIRLLFHLVATGAALYLAARFVPGIEIVDLPALALATIVLGLVNALVRPVLFFFTLPITCLTLGLFYLVVNGAAFGLTARLVPGFRVDGVVPAVLGALVVSVLSTVLGWFAPSPRRNHRDG
jgi:putative membrane protein